MTNIVENGQKTSQKGGFGHRLVAQTQFLTTIDPKNHLKKQLAYYRKFPIFTKKSAYMSNKDDPLNGIQKSIF